MVRTMAEGEEGRYVRNNIVEAMWEDVITRVKKLEVCMRTQCITKFIYLPCSYDSVILISSLLFERLK